MFVDLFIPVDGDIASLEEALHMHPPTQVFAPGSVIAYSNWGVALGGYLVEQISGEAFYAYVTHHIFEPLGMKETTIRPDLSDHLDVLSSRQMLRTYTDTGKFVPGTFKAIPLYPAGMAVGTLFDFRLSAQELLTPTLSKLFSEPQTADTFFSTSLFYDNGMPRNSHGLWHYNNASSVVGHGGNTVSCSSPLLIDRDNNVGYVVMSNQQNENLLYYEFPALIFGKFEQSPYYDSTTPIPKNLLTSARSIFRGPLSFTSLIIQQMEESD